MHVTRYVLFVGQGEISRHWPYPVVHVYPFCVCDLESSPELHFFKQGVIIAVLLLKHFKYAFICLSKELDYLFIFSLEFGKEII